MIPIVRFIYDEHPGALNVAFDIDDDEDDYPDVKIKNCFAKALTVSQIVRQLDRYSDLHEHSDPFNITGKTPGALMGKYKTDESKMKVWTLEKLIKYLENARKKIDQQHDIRRKRRIGSPYKCDICGDVFTEGGSLRRHKFIHTGEKPYKCYICGHAFIEKGNMVTHIRTHTGEKRYKCEMCCQTFAQGSALNSHKRTIHSW